MKAQSINRPKDGFIWVSVLYGFGAIIVLAAILITANLPHVLGLTAGLMGGFLTLAITRYGAFSTEALTVAFWIANTLFFMVALL